MKPHHALQEVVRDPRAAVGEAITNPLRRILDELLGRHVERRILGHRAVHRCQSERSLGDGVFRESAASSGAGALLTRGRGTWNFSVPHVPRLNRINLRSCKSYYYTVLFSLFILYQIF